MTVAITSTNVATPFLGKSKTEESEPFKADQDNIVTATDFGLSNPIESIQLILDRLLSMQPFSSQQTPYTTSGQPSMFGTTSGAGPTGSVSSTIQQAQERMCGFFERMRTSLQSWIQNSADTLRVYVNQYPPLAAFLFTLLVLSALPISVFVIFGLVTSGIFLSIALVGFTAIEGFVLLTSGGVLMAILGGIAFFTTIGFVLISGIYLSYRGGSALFHQVWQGAGQLSGSVRETAQRVGSQLQQGLGQQSTSGLGGYGTSMGGMAGGNSPSSAPSQS